MKLTCVTATFNCIKSGNRERLIRCIESVAKLQTEHEHLIYDGASADGTADLLRELEKRIPCLKVVSEPDTGIYNALNKGVRDAKGEWFYVLGCDDYIMRPDIMDDMFETANDGCDMMVTTVQRDGGSLLFRSLDDLGNIAYSNAYSHQGVLMQTAIVREFGGFDENNPVSADYDMFWKAHKRGVGVKYSFRPYAFYAKGGFSSDQAMCREWDAKLIKRHLNLTDEQAINRCKKSLPIAKIIPLFKYKDLAIRKCARRLLRDRVKFYLRILFYPIVAITRPIRHRCLMQSNGSIT